MDLSNFHLTFNDDFNSFDSSPDGSHGWKTQFYFNGRSLPSNGEQEYYSDTSVGVNPFNLANGTLTITAAPGSNPDGLAYNSGMISTEGDFTQTYGYFEVHAQLPQGQGMWPGFWMLNADKSWPPEIDVLEAFGATNANGEGGSNQVHVNSISHALNSWGGSEGGGGWVTIPGNIYSDYHTYGVDWEPDNTTFYIDGQQVYQVATPSDMNKPMYMIANLAVGGPWAGNAWGNTGQMAIDYIRAYSKDGNVPVVTSPDSSSHDSSGPGTGSSTVTVHVSEDAWNGDAQFVVLVDGQQLGGTQTATANHSAGQWQDVTVNGSFDSGPHTVSVHYINDAWGGAGADRNLYVQSIDINGQHIAGTTATNTADNGADWMDPSAAVMAVNGTADFHSGSGTPTGSDVGTGSSAVTLHVSEDAWNGDAQFNVLVDGHQVGGTQTATANHSAGQWQDVTVNGSFDSGPHTVSVQYINDAWGGTSSTDRNLYVQSVDINGQHIAGNTATNTAAAGAESADPSAAVMMTDGTADFYSGSGTPTTGGTGSATSTLTLHVSEDAWNGDAQFNVLVDGHQVGGVQTATASHSAGQTQAITLTGDFGSTGPGQVSVQFVNDAWGGWSGADRNLYVQSLDVNGQHFAGNAASNTADGGIAWTDPGSAVMAVNGTATFDVHHSAPPEIMG
jgi:beta-glucanase (GH16 family)